MIEFMMHDIMTGLSNFSSDSLPQTRTTVRPCDIALDKDGILGDLIYKIYRKDFEKFKFDRNSWVNFVK